MEGKILGIDTVQNKAVIITKNSERITFDLYEWRGASQYANLPKAI